LLEDNPGLWGGQIDAEYWRGCHRHMEAARQALTFRTPSTDATLILNKSVFYRPKTVVLPGELSVRADGNRIQPNWWSTSGGHVATGVVSKKGATQISRNRGTRTLTENWGG